MATQLALQRNFVTITPANQIVSTASIQSTQSTMTTSPADGEIVSITTSGNHTTQSDATNGVRVVSAHTQVRIHPFIHSAMWIDCNNWFFDWISWTEEVHSPSGHNIGWRVDNWCRTNRSIGFNRRCTNHCVHNYPSRFGRLIAKQSKFTANHSTSGIRPSGRHNRFGFETTFHHGQWYVGVWFCIVELFFNISSAIHVQQMHGTHRYTRTFSDRSYPTSLISHNRLCIRSYVGFIRRRRFKLKEIIFCWEITKWNNCRLAMAFAFRFDSHPIAVSH